MRKTASKTTLYASTFIVTACFLPANLRGQAIPGPMPPAQVQPPAQTPEQAKPKPQLTPEQLRNLAGSWKLNPDQSDDPHKKMQQARDRNRGGGPYGGHGGGGYPGGGYPGGGWPGGGGPYGGHHGGMGGQNDEDRERMRDLLNPADSLTIAQKDAEIDVTDDQNRQRVLYTDGRKLEKSKDDKYQELAAHWEGSLLVTEEKGPRGGKLSRSFELAPDGQQLFETVFLQMGRSSSDVSIRYVYDHIVSNKK
jgi:hypothetical protein